MRILLHNYLNTSENCGATRSLEMGSRLARAGHNVRGDVVFATSGAPSVALPAVGAAHGKDPVSRGFARWPGRHVCRDSSRIVALAPGMRDEIIATGCPANRVAVIPNRADPARWLSAAGEAALDLARTRFNRDMLALELESVLLEAVRGDRT
ncbi:MAG: glycosyltransferase [Coriobacteriia bacterium]